MGAFVGGALCVICFRPSYSQGAQKGNRTKHCALQNCFKKFRQVDVDKVSMHTKFGGHGFSTFGKRISF